MSKFVTRRDATTAVESPEALFRALRPRDSGVRHLWAHQADLLRDYQALATSVTDIASSNAEIAAELVVGEATGEDACRPDPPQARPARPRPGRRLRVRDRPRLSPAADRRRVATLRS